MKPRVICVMGRALDQLDGLGVYSVNLLRHMMAQDLMSRYVILLRSERNALIFKECPNAEIHVIPSRSKIWWDQVLVPLAARRVDADIIFNPKFSLPLFSKRPSVFVLHGSDWGQRIIESLSKPNASASRASSLESAMTKSTRRRAHARACRSTAATT